MTAAVRIAALAGISMLTRSGPRPVTSKRIIYCTSLLGSLVHNLRALTAEQACNRDFKTCCQENHVPCLQENAPLLLLREYELGSQEELFADVANEGMNTPRAYQAFWDHVYSLPEIGRFLDLEEEVQAMLDDWARL